MWNDVIRLLIAGGCGAVVGLVLQKLSPSTFRKSAAWATHSRLRMIYGLGFVFFTLCSAVNFGQGNVVYGVAGACLAVLEIAALIFSRRTPSSVSQ